MSATTVRDVSLDNAGDFKVAAGDLTLIAGNDAIVQAVRIALQFFKGEWFLNLEAGIPYFQSVLIKNPDVNVLRTVFRVAILAVPGILAVPTIALSLDRASRTLSVSYTATTDAGELDQTEVLTP